MAIKHTDGVGTMITGEHIELYMLLAAMRGLALEVNTGLRHSRGSGMLNANAASSRLDSAGLSAAIGVRVPTLGLKRTKRGALLDLMTYAAIVWRWEPRGDDDSVVRAIGGPEKWAPVARKVARILAAIDTACEAT